MSALALPNPLTEAEIDELESFIFSDAVSEEALDYIGIHGLLSALAICPEPVASDEWLEVIFDGTPGYIDDTQKDRIEGWLQREFAAISEELNQEEAPELPCDLVLDDEEQLLQGWTQAFMEGVFMRESAWFSQREEEVAELLLPIMLASELFDDPELVKMRKDRKLCQQLINEIPDLLTDLYLFFRVPEEKQKPPLKSGKGRR
ncbi:YecA family protein [Motiliproteus sediminis]|uniref:YecA/YgfB family protein n=1 Tax=Motiliproteus sediminis TaxID=1468178 RepID=UPI001AEFAFDB|nr:YecA family protein [Motiliproteus sediminis]